MLRGPSGSDRYGLRGISVQDKDRVRTANLLAERCSKAVRIVGQQGRICIAEQPKLRQGHAHMFALDSFKATLEFPQFSLVDGTQCPFGAAAPKATTWLIAGTSFSDMPYECKHRKRMWYAADGIHKVFARHAPSRGTMGWASAPPNAATRAARTYNTSRLQAYPPLLNRYLAAKIVLKVRNKRKSDAAPGPYLRFSFSHASHTATPHTSAVAAPTAASDAARSETPDIPQTTASSSSNDQPAWQSRRGKETVIMTQSLRGDVPIDPRTEAERIAIGGLRDTTESLKPLPSVTAFG